MHLRTPLTPIHRAWTGLTSPFFARTWAESNTTRETSSNSRCAKASSTTRCSRSHTPARVHTVNQRCAVDFDTPKHGGSNRHAHPPASTYTIATNTASSEAARLPPPRARNRTAGNNGRAISQSPSDTIHDHSDLFMPLTTPDAPTRTRS